MNVLKAAEHLAVHPNTIYLRLQRVRELTGLEPRSFSGLSELLVVVDCRCARTSPDVDAQAVLTCNGLCDCGRFASALTM